MKLIFAFIVIGPALASTCLTWILLAPEEIDPLWPVFIVLPLTLGLTFWSQVISKKYWDRYHDLKIIRIVGLAFGLLVGPLIFFTTK